MKHSEFLKLAKEAAGETLLHASYTLSPKQFAALEMGVWSMLSGLRCAMHDRLPPMLRAEEVK